LEGDSDFSKRKGIAAGMYHVFGHQGQSKVQRHAKLPERAVAPQGPGGPGHSK